MVVVLRGKVLVVAAALFLLGCGDSSTKTVDAAATPDTSPDVTLAPVPDTAIAPLDMGAAIDATDFLDPNSVDAGFGGPPPALVDNVTIHIAGDSTAAIFPATDPRVGWGAVLKSYFGPGVTIDDDAQSGRSSKSFIDEGFWSSLKARIKPGDYVFIEFGHNDEKYGDTARYTAPNSSYRYYLKTYIGETRALGGFAVLLTSISRRQFSGATVPDSHAAYTAAVLAVGAETGTPIIDMEAKTAAWLTTLGLTASAAFFAPGDNTHLNAQGAMVVAGMVAQGIREQGFPIAQRIVEPLDGGVGGVDGGLDGGDIVGNLGSTGVDGATDSPSASDVGSG